MKQALNYSIHDIIRFTITRAQNRGYRDQINLKFTFFETARAGDPDIALNIGKFEPSNKGCFLVDHNWYIKENYVFCRGAEGSARWKVEIKGLDNGNIEINFDGRVSGIQRLFNRDFIAQMLLLRMLEHRLAIKGCYLLHSAGVSKNGYGYVFAGRGSSFKSSICMNLVRTGNFEFLGDDHVLIYDNTVYPFPTSLSVLDFMYQNLPDENAWNIWNILRFVWSLKGKQTVSKQTLTKIGATSKLRRLFFIIRSDRQEPILRELGLNEAVEKFIFNNRLEDYIALSPMGVKSAPFLKQCLAYSFVFPSRGRNFCQFDFREKIGSLLTNILPVYEIQIPRKFSNSMLEQIHRLLE